MSMLAGPRRKQKVINLRAKNNAWSNDSNKFGQRMLEKMGWSSGKGLGARENGIVEHVMARYKNDEKGLGYEDKNDQWTKIEDEYNALLANLSGVSGNDNEEKLHSGVSLEEKSKKTKTRIHYHKFTRGKDVARYSEKDLANIFGKKSFKEKKEEKSEIDNEDLNTREKIFTEKGSMDDYFKKKMLAMKSKFTFNSKDDASGDNDDPETAHQGFGFKPFSSHNSTEENFTNGATNITEDSTDLKSDTEIDHNENNKNNRKSKRIKKNKKNRLLVETEVNESPLIQQNLESLNGNELEKTKKVKKSKKFDNDNYQVLNTEKPDKIGKKNKKMLKEQKYSITEDSQEVESTLNKNKKKGNNKSADQDTDNLIPIKSLDKSLEDNNDFAFQGFSQNNETKEQISHYCLSPTFTDEETDIHTNEINEITKDDGDNLETKTKGKKKRKNKNVAATEVNESSLLNQDVETLNGNELGKKKKAKNSKKLDCDNNKVLDTEEIDTIGKKKKKIKEPQFNITEDSPSVEDSSSLSKKKKKGKRSYSQTTTNITEVQDTKQIYTENISANNNEEPKKKKKKSKNKN